MATTDEYAHGHHETVLAHHARRSIADSARFLAPHLASGLDLLDVGCGPGSITVELAERVAPGRVVAIDVNDDAIEQTRRAAAEAGADNIEVRPGNVYSLDADDGSFDIVYAHQVLQHLSDPVRALDEMRRVTKPGGVVACRDADYEAMLHAPLHPMLVRWKELYHQMNDRLDLEADAGRHLLGWAHQAGFEDVTVSSSTWTHATPEARQVWGQAWAKRCLESNYAEHALGLGLSDEQELRAISDAFRWWADQPDGVWYVLHGEIIAHR